MALPLIHHIAIEVTNVERSRAFYADALGLEEIPRLTEGTSKSGGAWFRLGGGDLHLQERSAGSAKTGQHFALVVEDFGRVVEKAKTLGGQVEEAKLLPGFSQRCFLRDPDHNRIELLQK